MLLPDALLLFVERVSTVVPEVVPLLLDELVSVVSPFPGVIVGEGKSMFRVRSLVVSLLSELLFLAPPVYCSLFLSNSVTGSAKVLN